MRIKVDHRWAGADAELLAELIQHLTGMENRIMATLDEVKADMQAAKDAIVQEKAEVAAMGADLSSQIQALRDQLAAGTAVTEADLADLSTTAKEITASVQNITEPSAPAA